MPNKIKEQANIKRMGAYKTGKRWGVQNILKYNTENKALKHPVWEFQFFRMKSRI